MLAADAEAARVEAEAEAEAQRATWREETLRDYMVNLAIQASTLRPASPERNAVHAAYREVAEELRRQG